MIDAKITSFWTVPELAAQLKVPPGTIYYWASRGDIPHKRIGKHLRFCPREISDWIESQSPSKDHPGSNGLKMVIGFGRSLKTEYTGHVETPTKRE